jgi:hypothetical protein
MAREQKKKIEGLKSKQKTTTENAEQTNAQWEAKEWAKVNR